MSINLEIMTVGMAAPDENGERHSAEWQADVQDYSVELLAVHFDSGEIETLLERDDLDYETATEYQLMLERLFPQASSEEIPS